ncbi:hypothetical protein EYF80_046694 [Liparis tanakae]|uniref:Uncharacterized protein n=1 Tax=Liparis tanakae TaxID=230148 RepID=A0A4Z2FQF9_9TELE|nr:hypothetical protein EYF80_046694 [Liparis tanakae]
MAHGDRLAASDGHVPEASGTAVLHLTQLCRTDRFSTHSVQHVGEDSAVAFVDVSEDAAPAPKHCNNTALRHHAYWWGWYVGRESRFPSTSSILCEGLRNEKKKDGSVISGSVI